MEKAACIDPPTFCDLLSDQDLRAAKLGPGVGFEPTRPRGPTAVLAQLRQHVLKINAFCIVLRDIDADYAIGHLTIT